MKPITNIAIIQQLDFDYAEKLHKMTHVHKKASVLVIASIAGLPDVGP